MRKLVLACFVVIAFGACHVAFAQGRGAGLRAVTQLPSKEKRWALIVGVDDYSNGIQKLYGAVNDSKALKDALVKYANFPEDQVIVLTTGGDGEQPTRTNILTRLFRLKEKVPKDGLLLFAFSGHGVERDRKVFLLPSDALQTRDVEELKQIAIPADTITEQIERAEIKQVLILLDACRNDPEAGKGDKDNVLTEAFRSGFSFEVQNSGVEAFATFYATSFGKRAYEFRDKETGLQRGFFSWALVKGIEGGAANVDGEVTLGGLVSYVTEGVPRKLKAENVGGEQIPYPIIGGYNADELVIALTAGSGRGGGAASSAQSYFNRGRALEKEGKFDDAIREYEKAINLDPKYVHAYNYMGNAYEAKGLADQAIKIYTRVIELDPAYQKAYYNRGVAYGDMGMHDRAIGEYDKAIKLNPLDADAFVNRGVEYSRKGDFSRALKNYDEAIRLNPKLVLAYYNRGFAYEDEGRYDEALRDFNEVITLDPHNLDAHYKRGQIHAAIGDLAKAITDLSVVITFKPQDADALFYRAHLNTGKGNYKDALADLEMVIRFKPEWGDAYSARGWVYNLMGEDVKALADFNKAIEINPKDPSALNGRGTLYWKDGRNDRAIADFQLAVTVNPDDFLGYLELGFIYAEQGDYVRANDNFKRLKGVIKQSASGGERKPDAALKKQLGETLVPDLQKLPDQFLAGISFMADKEFDKAADAFGKAIKEAPQFAFLHLLRGWAYVMNGDNNAALSDANVLLALNPEDASAYAFRGAIYEEMGNYQQAIAIYSEMIRLSPNNVQAYRSRADAYEKLGDMAKARADRHKADALEGRKVNR